MSHQSRRESSYWISHKTWYKISYLVENICHTACSDLWGDRKHQGPIFGSLQHFNKHSICQGPWHGKFYLTEEGWRSHRQQALLSNDQRRSPTKSLRKNFCAIPWFLETRPTLKQSSCDWTKSNDQGVKFSSRMLEHKIFRHTTNYGVVCYNGFTRLISWRM